MELLNLMCVLVLTRGNGTPFHATSRQEEDIVEFCVEMGQQPNGVLQLLATESVVLFHSGDKMLVTKATVLHKEPIRVCTSPSLLPI